MPFDAIRLAWRRQNKMSPLEPSHMNALPGGDRLIPFSLAPTGLTRFFEVTQAKAWAKLSWPFGPFTPPLERAPTGPSPICIAPRRNLFRGAWDRNVSAYRLSPVPGPEGPRKVAHAKTWASMLSWPFGPFTPRLERAPAGPSPICIAPRRNLFRGAWDRNVSADRLWPVPRPEGPRKLSPGFSLGCPKKTRQPCRGKRSLFVPWKALIREAISRPGHRLID
jgi:hypothetical protein